MNTELSELLLSIYKRLRQHFGHRNWWPGETPFEVIIGAILTQNTAWTNVEKAIGNLKADEALTPERILSLPIERLAELIRSSGYYNQKALRLKIICQYIIDRCDGDLSMLSDVSTDVLREELLAIKGIGPETADSILLYALDRTVFVVDAYTKRALIRIGLINDGAKYEDIQRLFVDNLENDRELFNDYHAQFVALGKYYCKSKPDCVGCPLEDICTYSRSDTLV
ncbi:MAG: endonuclease III domain-containing protein [Candidatus Hatepunaea meridiana]|nr:endonuclease III domain-containing protein [Candidatus Hatepunaea meridiana]